MDNLLAEDKAMLHKRIKKIPQHGLMPPNLLDYNQVYKNFSWQQAENFITGFEGGGVNIAYEAVDRHVDNGLAEKIAIRWLNKNEKVEDYSYRDLSQLSNRFAGALHLLGLKPGARVFTLLGRRPELYITALGTFKAGCVFTPLFSAFGPQPIRSRMEIGEANVLVTSLHLYHKKVAQWWTQLPHLKYIIIIDGNGSLASGCHYFSDLMAHASPLVRCAHTDKDDAALLHFTSGTTGEPKGVVHVHGAVLAHIVSAYYALDLHREDVYWCTADPGWVTGTSYGIIAPLCHGVTMIVDEAEFDAARWYRILEQESVTVWYTAPTAIRLLMKIDPDLRQEYHLDKLRFIASVGEALHAEAVIWGQNNFGQAIHDNWWQTETGAIMIANYASQDVKAGSMGRPLPGIKAAIVTRNEQGDIEVICEPMKIGELAFSCDWPSMFVEYLNQPERYAQCFEQGWYLSGDLAKCDEDGYYWFVARANDLIKSSGHLIGPFEVESVLMAHEAVAEAAVIGKPDPLAGEVVKAFVSLHSGYTATDALRQQIRGFTRQHLGAAIAPKEIDIVDDLPKTRSGKIMRRLLKARELGLPEGDISTLENYNSKQ